MIGLLQLLRLDVVFETISMILGVVIAVQSLRAHRVLRSSSFLLLGVGFTLMCVAMLVRVAVVGLFVTAPPMGRQFALPFFGLVTAELVYSAIRIVAYVVFLAAYAASRLGVGRELMAAFPILLTIYNPIFELVSAALLVYVVIETAHNWAAGRPRGSGVIFAGFLALLLSHILFFLTPLGTLYYLLGHAAQLSSLTMILLGTHEAGSTSPASTPQS